MSAHTIPLSTDTPSMTAAQAGLIRECLDLARDQLEADVTGALDRLAVAHLIAHLAPALRLAQRCQSKGHSITGGAQ